MAPPQKVAHLRNNYLIKTGAKTAPVFFSEKKLREVFDNELLQSMRLNGKTAHSGGR